MNADDTDQNEEGILIRVHLRLKSTKQETN